MKSEELCISTILKDLGLEQDNCVQTPATHDVTEEAPELLDQVQHSKYRPTALEASESKGIVSFLKDLGYEMKPVLAIDGKVTAHILHRQGIGRLEHIDVAYLWM